MTLTSTQKTIQKIMQDTGLVLRPMCNHINTVNRTSFYLGERVVRLNTVDALNEAGIITLDYETGNYTLVK